MTIASSFEKVRVCGVTLGFVILLVCSSCTSVLRTPLYSDLRVENLSTEERADRTRNYKHPEATRVQIENPVLRVLMFPVSLVPNYIGNMVTNLPPGNLWLIQYLVLPFSSGYYAARDSWHGYPFWEPTARWN